MSSTTTFTGYVYACPEDQREAAAEVMSGFQLNYRGNDGRTLCLTKPYTDDMMDVGGTEFLAGNLRAAAPGASFALWEDPAQGVAGWFRAYTPELGPFAAECNQDGVVLFTRSQVIAAVDNAGRNGPAYAGPASMANAITAAIDRAMGEPWLEDYRNSAAWPSLKS